MQNKHIWIISICVLVIAVLGWIYFIYPTATVEVSPRIDAVKKETEIKSSLHQKNLNQEQRLIPLHQFEITLTDSSEIPTVEEKKTGNKPAKGKVKFINETRKEIRIPQGTVLKSENGEKYKTEKKATIPELKEDYLDKVKVGVKAGETEVPIEAVKEGSSGNVDSGEISEFEEDQYENVYVINPDPVEEGEDSKVPVVGEKDIERLKKSLKEKMESSLITQIYKKFGRDYRIIEDKINITDIEYDLNHEEGDRAENLKATADLTAEGFLIDSDELNQIVKYIINNDIKLDYSDSNILNLDLEETENEMYNIKMELEIFVVQDIDVSEITDQIVGLKVDEVREVLQNNDKIESFEVITDKNYMPGLNFAVKMVVNNPEKGLVNKSN
ncbi:MAG: baseplate J/gp47 family protein [Halanaerobiaceae bacterium]